MATSTADIIANDQISHADDYKPIIVGYNKGAAIRLSDVADVVDSVQNIRAAGYLNGKRAVMLIIFRQPGANIIETVDRIRAELPSIKASIPQGIDTTIVSGPHHDDSRVGAATWSGRCRCRSFWSSSWYSFFFATAGQR